MSDNYDFKEVPRQLRGIDLAHKHGNYLCIPNWDVGTELSSLTDLFWNEERLRHYSRMKKADACTIVSALKVLAEHECMN